MIEDEAKSKVCFQAVGFNADRYVYSGSDKRAEDRTRGVESNRPPLCLGSACMAWLAQTPIQKPAPDRDGKVWIKTGYCGLVRAPTQ